MNIISDTSNRIGSQDQQQRRRYHQHQVFVGDAFIIVGNKVFLLRRWKRGRSFFVAIIIIVVVVSVVFVAVMLFVESEGKTRCSESSSFSDGFTGFRLLLLLLVLRRWIIYPQARKTRQVNEATQFGKHEGACIQEVMLGTWSKMMKVCKYA